MENKRAFEKLCDDLFWRVVILIQLLGGGYAAYWGVTQEALAHASKNWPSITGQVLSSFTRVAHSKGGLNHFPEVTYRYKINGIAYENDTIHFGQVSHRWSDTGEIMGKYPQGKFVPVYYNPNALGTSCLEPGKYRSISSASVFLGFFFFTGGFIMFLGRWFLLSLQHQASTSSGRRIWF